MMKTCLTVLLATFFLSACAVGPSYNGYPIKQESYKVDGGNVVNFPFTRAGPLPSENENYKISGAGFLGELRKGNPKESKLTWTFAFDAKKDVQLTSVTVEKVTDAGTLELMVQDTKPVIKDKTWVGKSAPVSMAQDSQPWLYENSNSVFIFKFTIQAKNEKPVVLYQPSMAFSQVKAVYLKILGVK